MRFFTFQKSGSAKPLFKNIHIQCCALLYITIFQKTIGLFPKIKSFIYFENFPVWWTNFMRARMKGLWLELQPIINWHIIMYWSSLHFKFITLIFNGCCKTQNVFVRIVKVGVNFLAESWASLQVVQNSKIGFIQIKWQFNDFITKRHLKPLYANEILLLCFYANILITLVASCVI